MTQQRSERYRAIKDEQAANHRPGTWTWARRWMARVGLPRLTAAAVAHETSYLLRDINLSTFRNKPEIRALLLRARRVNSDLAIAIAQDNWRDFDRGMK